MFIQKKSLLHEGSIINTLSMQQLDYYPKGHQNHPSDTTESIVIYIVLDSFITIPKRY